MKARAAVANPLEEARKHVAVDRVREHCWHMIEDVDKFADLNVRKGHLFDAVQLIGSDGAGRHLDLAMMAWLLDNDVDATRSNLLAAAGFIPRMTRTIARATIGCEQGDTRWSRTKGALTRLAVRFPPLHRAVSLVQAVAEDYRQRDAAGRSWATARMEDAPMCMVVAAILTATLDRHLDTLLQFAPLITEHHDDDYASLDALGLLAAITEDAALQSAFEHRVVRYLADPRRHDYFKGNFVQLRALIAGHQHDLDKATEAAQRQFTARRRDRSTLGLRLGLGLYGYINLDLLGVAIGKLALRKGMRFDHDSRAMPRGLVTLF